MNYVERLDSIESKPYLFSYRRCPYAMRARMALVESDIDFDIYEIFSELTEKIISNEIINNICFKTSCGYDSDYNSSFVDLYLTIYF